MGWWNDLEWDRSGVTVKKTGARIEFNADLLKDLAKWLPYGMIERVRAPLKVRDRIRVYALPTIPRYWYLLRVCLSRLGVQFVDNAKDSDLAIYFDDSTYSDAPHLLNGPIVQLNFECNDISKTYVQTIFKDIFGYDLGVDPTEYTGAMVAKSEINGTHTGKIVQGPCEAEDGYVYQKLIDNRSESGRVTDIRCPTLFGEIPLIYLKSRPETQRFDNLNTHVVMSTAEEQFTHEETEKIRLFCNAMKLDWGGLDILRDADDGRIYIVDVNKTDMGPPFSLPLKDKLKSTSILAKALEQAIENRVAEASNRITLQKDKTL
ncbi:MAG: hypothetical protein ABJ275_04115 [Maricaulaceae bacterium]